MPTVSERAKDWWEGKAPRERRLLAVLGATLVVCLLGWVAMTIRGGLTSIEKKNDRSRDALEAIELHRMVAQSKASGTPIVTIPTTAVDLASYLDGIITEAQLKSPSYPSPKKTVHGENTELAIHIALQDLTIGQLEQLLENIETRNPVVVVTELKVSHPNYRDQDKLDVDLTIATFYKESKDAKGTSGATPAGGGAPAAGAAGKAG